MKRYVVFVEIGKDGKLSRALGTDGIWNMDGRLTNLNALLRAKDWGAHYAKFKNIKHYTLALVSVYGFKWGYLSHLNLPDMPHVSVANIKPIVEE